MKWAFLPVVLMSMILCFGLYCSPIFAVENAAQSAVMALNPVDDLSVDTEAAIENTILWVRGNGDYAINELLLQSAGYTGGDWLAIALGRYGYPDDYDAFLEALEDHVSTLYQEEDKLDNSKATEWHRISLAILALGGDPTAFGVDGSGNAINLIADGTYEPLISSLWKQGINGAIFGLITLDTMEYAVPANAKYQRDEIIAEILSRQKSDGGFALSGTTSDPDITAMALQALAPYVDSETLYNGETVGAVVDEAVAWLSLVQAATGDYLSWGARNAESTSQVILALCSLRINPDTDARFIKNGKSALDGLMVYYNAADGGFIHSFVADAENPDATAGETNYMATDQARLALIAYYRLVNGYNAFYDYTEEPNRTADEISALIAEVNALPANITLNDEKAVNAAVRKYRLFNSEDQAKVTNSAKLTAALAEIDNLKNPLIEKMQDVSTSHWAYSYINTVMNAGLFGGTSATAFEPETSMTRAMFVMVLSRLEGVDLTSYESLNLFSDIAANKWYTGAVNWAASEDIIDGVGNGKFAPNQNISRQEMAKMIIAYADYTGDTLPEVNAAATFTDQSKIAAWASEYVIKAQKAGLINGYSDGSFKPLATATRAEVSTIFARYLGIVSGS